jgi:hypothetical protein
MWGCKTKAALNGKANDPLVHRISGSFFTTD